MGDFYHVVVKQRPSRSPECEGVTIATAVFFAEEPHRVGPMVSDALLELRIIRESGPEFAVEFVVTPIADLPPDKAPESPDWANEHLKLWAI
jgi:hypothetical protein